MRIVALLATLLTTACCTSLPRLPAKRVAFHAPAVRFADVLESAGHFYNEKRSRDIEVRSYSPAGPRGRLPVVLVSHGIGEDPPHVPAPASYSVRVLTRGAAEPRHAAGCESRHVLGEGRSAS